MSCRNFSSILNYEKPVLVFGQLRLTNRTCFFYVAQIVFNGCTGVICHLLGFFQLNIPQLLKKTCMFIEKVLLQGSDKAAEVVTMPCRLQIFS